MNVNVPVEFDGEGGLVSRWPFSFDEVTSIYRTSTATVDGRAGRNGTVMTGVKSGDGGFLAPCTARNSLKGDWWGWREVGCDKIRLGGGFVADGVITRIRKSCQGGSP